MEASVVREAVAGNADPKDLPVRSPAGEPTSMSEKISPDHPKADLGFPEGGLRAWLVVLGTGLVLSSTVGLVSSWGVFQTYYATELLSGTDPSNIAWIGSIQYFLVYLPSLLSGRLFDFGYLKLPMAIASTVLVAALLLLAQCTAYWQVLLCQGLTCGLACGTMYGPAMTVLGHWFRDRLGIAVGIASLGVSFGGTVFPILIRKLIPVVGFPWTMRILAFVIAASLICANLAVARRLPPTPSNGKIISFVILKNKAFTTYTISGFFAFQALWTLSTYLDQSAQAAGISPDFSVYLLSILNASAAFGRIGGGLVMDRIGPINTMIPFNLVAATLIYTWPTAKDQASFIVIAALYGVASGPISTMFLTPLYRLVGDADDLGGRLGMASSLSAFGDLFGLPIAGALLQTPLRFQAIGLYGGSTFTISILGMFLMKWLVLGDRKSVV